jgi:hypothetical protein
MKKLIIAVAVLAGLFLAIQFVPYGRDHSNPPVIGEPTWNSPETKALAVRACFDCHSNETVWPWYSNIAPVSWLNQHDVDEARQKLNFSEWSQNNNRYRWNEIEEVIQSGQMPLPMYVMMHPTAKLTSAEKNQLIEGLLISTGQK